MPSRISELWQQCRSRRRPRTRRGRPGVRRGPKPRLPISLTGTPINPSPSSSADFSWSVVSGVTYTCVLDGASTTGCATPESPYPGLADGSHTFVVKGKKPGGYRPGQATFRWVVDSVPPGAPTIAPVATPTKTRSASISFVNPDVSTVFHQCSLDGALATTCTNGWPVPGPLDAGPHTVTVQAFGLGGSPGGTASVTWFVDLTAPESVLLAGPASPTNVTTAHFTFSSVDATSYTCALDTAAPWRAPARSTCLASPKDPHALTVAASDGAGNAALPGTAPWVVDTTAPPTPSILTGPATATNQTGVDFLVDNPDSVVRPSSATSTTPVGAPAQRVPLHSLDPGRAPPHGPQHRPGGQPQRPGQRASVGP